MKIATRTGATALALALACAFPAYAQITADTAAGRNLGTVVTPGVHTWSITGGTTVGGTNLFQSFSQFGVPSGDTATFSGAGGISNIIARVTGGARSDIYGTLASSIAGANLWFINPAGIAFGPNAHLSIGGSFHASTASYLKLGLTGRFDAANPGASVLTVDTPSAFGFSGPPAAITLDRSVLTVPNGKTLSLVGGALTATGTTGTQARIQAPGGRINLASLAGPGEATLLPGGAIDTASAGTLGAITLTNAIVHTEIAGTPGPIVIRGGRLTLADSFISTAHNTPGAGADIDIGLSGDFSMSAGVIRSSSVGTGDAGNVKLTAGNVTASAGAVIDSSSIDITTFSGTGRAGQTTINASGDVLLTGGSALTSITFGGSGPGGDTSISARSLTLSDNANIKVSTFGDGNAGRVRVAVADLTLSSGGHIDANTEFDTALVPGVGAGGNIQVDATRVEISGEGSGLFSKTTSFGAGGSITVNAQDILIRDGGRISSQSVDAFHIGTGNAGSIQLAAANSLSLQNGGAISTESESALGGGGRITIQAGNVLALDHSSITTSVKVGGGNGGDIVIDPVFTTLNASDIIARAIDGNGGNIFIVTQFLLQSPDSNIDATSQRGISGNVQISSPASDVGSRLGVLPSGYIDPSSLLRAACAARAGRPGSSFVGVGRGGLPASPDSAAFASYGIAPFTTSYGSGSSSAALLGITVRAASCPGAVTS